MKKTGKSRAEWERAAQTRFSEEFGERARLVRLLDLFEKSFSPGGELFLFSAPGRTEIGGNHTDHQHGCVLAAAINLDTMAAVRKNDSNVIRILSEGYRPFYVKLSELEARENERNTTTALCRGILAQFRDRGARLSGFDAAVVSNVLRGSGLSSSASFEVLFGVILNCLFFEEQATPVEIAQIGQHAENVYFGKPSGLMDQMASSVGNLVAIDFEDPDKPVVERVDFDFAKTGHSLCIIDSGADHAGLTDEYAAIPEELYKISAFFGKRVLREVPENQFYESLPALRACAGDRAVLRAIHFYGDNRRVKRQIEALRAGDFTLFLTLVRESGQSSFQYLQNVIPAGSREHQDMAVALALAERLLGARGAYRVHGGGFAGTIQAFVPDDRLDTFREKIEAVLGTGSCHVLAIRPEGGTQLP